METLRSALVFFEALERFGYFSDDSQAGSQKGQDVFTMEQPQFSVKLSAPGKVILFGEYSVVFKKPAIATTLSLRTNLHLYKTNSNIIQLDFSALNLSKSFSMDHIQEYFKVPSMNSWDSYLKSLTHILECLYEKTNDGFVLTEAQKLALLAFFHCFGKVLNSSGGFGLKIDTELPVGSGVGSSASFSVVLSAAALIFEYFVLQRKTSDLIERTENGIKILETFRKEISDLAFSCEKIFHGSPSGVDHNTVLRGSVLEFIKSDDNNNTMTSISTDSLKILLVNTNIPRSTKKLVTNVKGLKENHPEVIDCVLNGMENIAKSAVKTLIRFNNEKTTQLEAHFGDLVSLNHNLLRVLGASHPALEQIVSIAEKYNLKAKLTGAGGGGFGFIYLPDNIDPSVVKTVEKELTASGFTVYDVSLGGPGLTIEELVF